MREFVTGVVKKVFVVFCVAATLVLACPDSPTQTRETPVKVISADEKDEKIRRLENKVEEQKQEIHRLRTQIDNRR